MLQTLTAQSRPPRQQRGRKPLHRLAKQEEISYRCQSDNDGDKARRMDEGGSDKPVHGFVAVRCFAVKKIFSVQAQFVKV